MPNVYAEMKSPPNMGRASEQMGETQEGAAACGAARGAAARGARTGEGPAPLRGAGPCAKRPSLVSGVLLSHGLTPQYHRR